MHRLLTVRMSDVLSTYVANFILFSALSQNFQNFIYSLLFKKEKELGRAGIRID